MRLQQNRPKLKIGELDRNSDLSDFDLKSPNFVVQPMALGPDLEEAPTPSLGFHGETMQRREGNLMIQGEMQ